MFTIEYNHKNYAQLISDMACKMERCLKNNTLILPGEIGNGYFKYILLSNGLECILCDYKLQQDMYMFRKKTEEQFYVLRFDEFSISDKLMVKIGTDYIWEDKQNRASVLLTSSQNDFAYQVAKDTSLRSISVLISREWLSQYLDIISMDKVLEKYLELKTESYNFVPFDIEYRTLFNEVMESDETIMKQSILENRIMMMVERFLTQLYERFSHLSQDEKIKIPSDEIKRLMEVESYLVKDFSTPPPPISYLSRVAAMSSTTLKNKFKKLYGNNLYEYFQKSRMHKAKVLLLSKKYTIKEIGSLLGYSNLSNFATAFKKEFKKLPSKLFR